MLLHFHFIIGWNIQIEPVSIACAVDQTPPRPLIFENPLRTPNPDYDAEFDLPDGSGDLRPSNSLKPNEIQSNFPVYSSIFKLYF